MKECDAKVIVVAMALIFATLMLSVYILMKTRGVVSGDRGVLHFASHDDELERIGCDLGGCQLVDGAFVCPQLDGDRYANR